MDAAKIAERLRELRGSRSQKEVAEAIGVSRSTYNMYELGERIPKDEIKKKISAYYHKSVATLFFAD